MKKEKGDQITVPLVMRLTGEGVTGDSTLDITDDFLEGLNAAYVKSKASKE